MKKKEVPTGDRFSFINSAFTREFVDSLNIDEIWVKGDSKSVSESGYVLYDDHHRDVDVEIILEGKDA